MRRTWALCCIWIHSVLYDHHYKDGEEEFIPMYHNLITRFLAWTWNYPGCAHRPPAWMGVLGRVHLMFFIMTIGSSLYRWYKHGTFFHISTLAINQMKRHFYSWVGFISHRKGTMVQLIKWKLYPLLFKKPGIT